MRASAARSRTTSTFSGALLFSLVARTPLKVDVVRDRAALARIVEGGQLENVYRLQVMNATERPQRYLVEVRGLAGLRVADAQPIEVEPAAARWVVLRLRVPADQVAAGSHPVYFDVREADGAVQVSEKSVFLVPR